jgi:hypothetical protein
MANELNRMSGEAGSSAKALDLRAPPLLQLVLSVVQILGIILALVKEMFSVLASLHRFELVRLVLNRRQYDKHDVWITAAQILRAVWEKSALEETVLKPPNK